jgi:Xylanase inhibitor N-terminal
MSFDLHPTAYLEGERRLGRRLGEQHHDDAWFEEGQNAVYSTIPDWDDTIHADNEPLRQFYATRHLSRYEVQHRQAAGIDLQISWNGTYEHDAHALEEPFAEQERRIRHGRRLQEADAGAGAGVGASAGAYGGQFDSYQAIPLSQGYGTHFANVWVGSPVPQRKTVIVDTGSHYTAFPCTGCNNCGAPHHTDPYFNPELSKTFHALHCDECRDGVVCSNGQCVFSQSYTEGSSWEAVQVTDRFYCGGSDILDSVEPDYQKYAIEDFMFGCQQSMTGLFITQLADGIMGMSAHPATIGKQLFDRKIIEHNLFAMCFRRELGTSKRGVTAGSMTLGGFSTALDTSPMVYAKNMASSGWFTVYVKNIYIRSGGGQSATSRSDQRTIRVRIDPGLLNSGKGVIVDSGTTDTYLNQAVAREFNRAWKRATGKAYSHASIRLTAEELRTLPTILVQCHAYTHKADPSIEDYSSIPGYAGQLDPRNPNDLLIAIPATSYMDYSAITKMYTSRVYFTETAGGVLGSNAMQGHNVVFDWENGRIGFAESSCSYDKRDVPKAALDEGYASECIVGNPVVKQSCIETVDRRLCKHNPTNIALLGTETFTALVESPGTGSGTSCVDSAKERRPGNAMDEPVIKCAGDGVCEEYRPCQLTCSQAEKAATISAIEHPTPKDVDECGDSFWSACDYDCKQSRIVSRKFTDGNCHETSRLVRPCHIGACARSDPCRVPFLVHAVVGLRDGDVRKWSFEAEDRFVSALSRAAAFTSETKYFDDGDVNVLAVLPWYNDEVPQTWRNVRPRESEDVDPATAKHGIKVVFEIPVFNSQARVTNYTQATSYPDQPPQSSFSSLLRNISTRLSAGAYKSTCNPSELFSLAKRALALKKEVLNHPQLLPTLISYITQYDLQVVNIDDQVFQDATLAASESRFLAVWSIRTEIDEEINYYGPPKPWWFRILALAHTTAFLFIGFMLISTIWSVSMTCFESVKYEAASPSSPLRMLGTRMGSPRHRYSSVSLTDDETTEAVVMGSGQEPGVVRSPGLKRHGGGTTPKKRRSTLVTQQSSDI